MVINTSSQISKLTLTIENDIANSPHFFLERFPALQRSANSSNLVEIWAFSEKRELRHTVSVIFRSQLRVLK
jgi:hypothetical protein